MAENLFDRRHKSPDDEAIRLCFLHLGYFQFGGASTGRDLLAAGSVAMGFGTIGAIAQDNLRVVTRQWQSADGGGQSRATGAGLQFTDSELTSPRFLDFAIHTISQQQPPIREGYEVLRKHSVDEGGDSDVPCLESSKLQAEFVEDLLKTLGGHETHNDELRDLAARTVTGAGDGI